MRERFDWPWVEAQVEETCSVWKSCAGRPDLPGAKYSQREQRKREQAYDEGLRSVEREARRAPRTQADRLTAQRRIAAVFPRFAAAALGLEGEAIQLLTDSFLPLGTGLARWARRYDPTLSTADLIQAARNAWTACGLQPLLGEPMELTPAIVGYSLLYPYSDNYLDHEQVSRAEKLEFSRRFRDRLHGEEISARNAREAAIWKMVSLIEEQYPRTVYPEVFACLLAIHRAQEASMGQMGLLAGSGRCNASDDWNAPDDSGVLRVSCAKGGTSVLADACLAHGWLSDEESRFSFEWGVLLQLGDDLQDVREDLRRGSATLFSNAAARREPLDRLVIQLLTFSERVADQIDRLPNGSATLKALLRMSWQSLVLMAVADAREFFTARFLAELEERSRFRFDFLRARNKRFKGQHGLNAFLFDAFLENSGEDTLLLPRFDAAAEASRLAHAEPQAEAVAMSGAYS